MWAGWTVEVEKSRYDQRITIQILGPSGHGYPVNPLSLSIEEAQELGVALIGKAAQAQITSPQKPSIRKAS